MTFMQRQITKKLAWYKGKNNSEDTRYAPEEELPEIAFARDVLGNIYARVEIVTGFGARLSAPGYLDCTDWAVFDTIAEAEAYLDEIAADATGDETHADQRQQSTTRPNGSQPVVIRKEGAGS
jgi:hypothetical protein